MPGRYGNFGALEKYVGNRQIVERAQRAYAAAGMPSGLDELTPLVLQEAARAGDEIAVKLWNDIAENLRKDTYTSGDLFSDALATVYTGVANARDVWSLTTGPRDRLDVARTLPTAFFLIVVKDGKIQFGFTMNIEGNAVSTSFSGTVAKDSLKGDVSYGDFAQGSFTAVKKQ